MIFLKTAWNNFRKNVLMNIFIILQVTICLIVTAVMVSTISIRSQYYTPFQNEISSKGLFLKYSTSPNFDPNKMEVQDFLGDEEILEVCPDAENVYSCHNLFGQIEIDGNYNFQSYDDFWIEKYQPEMKAGRWLTSSVESNQIEIVVSENDYGIDVGDVITFEGYNYPEGVSFTGKVVGVFADDAKMIGGYLYYSSENMDFNSLYYPFNHEVEGQMAILASQTAIQSITADVDLELDVDYVVQPITSNVLITYPEGESEAQIEADKQTLLQYGYADVVSLEEMKANSKAYILEEAELFFPIILVLILLVLISVISSSALTARKNLNNYAVYYVCGLQWKNCLLVSFFHSLITIVLSLFLSLLVLLLIPYTSFAESIRIIWSNYIVVSFIVLIFIQLFISMLMPTIVIGKNTPKQILTR
jgi:hypothetical protein